MIYGSSVALSWWGRCSGRLGDGGMFQDRSSTKYDAAHTRARAAAAARHSPNDLCARCGRRLGPMGPWLHYDHKDDRSGYLGFSHGRCNVRAGARKGRQKQIAAKKRIRW